MILNASPDLACSYLPPDLSDVYVNYKRSTRAVIAWLCQCASINFDQSKRFSLGDLTAFAITACELRCQLPEAVDFQFRETIRAREYLSRRFRCEERHTGASTETENHEFFTKKYFPLADNSFRL